ncbi:MAG: putative cytochrome c, class I:Iron permease precursor [Nitrobacter vulgaris]|nr:putative cytochrome c, class I:Iron permease precursor [Nitrobacter vulgaris]
MRPTLVSRQLAKRIGLVLLLFLSSASSLWADDEAKRIVALIDYIGGDYRNAVQGGKVLNSDEYQEMSEFSARSLELFRQLKSTEGDKAAIEKDLNALAAHIKNKSGDDAVPELAQQIKDRLIKTYSIVTYPKALPSYASARMIYLQNCAQCHGESGKGDGPGRESMNPKTPAPANFTDAEFMAGLSPFKVYNTTTFGIDNTAMASFAALPDEQRWQVAFYVLTLRFPAENAAAGESWLKGKSVLDDLVSVATLATSSDDDLSGRITKLFPEAPVEQVLAYLRRGLLEKKTSDPLLIARTLVGEAAQLYSSGEKEKAYQKAIEAYLDGFEMAEPALFAKDAALGRSVEAQFTQFRNTIKQDVSVAEIQKQQQAIEANLDLAAQKMAAGSDRFSGYYAFLNSALIILREGLEAALILAAIITMLKVMGTTDAIRYIHLGWVLALFCGVLTWLAAQTVLTLSGQHRESMEGFISIFAAAALFYVGYWLHTRSEAKRWHAFIQDRVQNVLSSKRILGLVGISFFAVYREAFEVVLFYQALWLQNAESHQAIIGGFLAGVVALLAATLAIFKLGVRIPLKYFFGITGTLLYIMAFIFAGMGINQLQAAGWVPATPVEFPPAVPLLGIYPTMETLAVQGLLLCAFIATSFWMGHERTKALA